VCLSFLNFRAPVSSELMRLTNLLSPAFQRRSEFLFRGRGVRSEARPREVSQKALLRLPSGRLPVAPRSQIHPPTNLFILVKLLRFRRTSSNVFTTTPRLAGHRTKWPCDQFGPPGPPPAHHPSCPLDPRGAGWGEISALMAA
jgi:hypothetical protein